MGMDMSQGLQLISRKCPITPAIAWMSLGIAIWIKKRSERSGSQKRHLHYTHSNTADASPVITLPESELESEEVVVPVDRKWAKGLLRMSGGDGVVNVHLDVDGDYKRKSKSVSGLIVPFMMISSLKLRR